MNKGRVNGISIFIILLVFLALIPFVSAGLFSDLDFNNVEISTTNGVDGSDEESTTFCAPAKCKPNCDSYGGDSSSVLDCEESDKSCCKGSKEQCLDYTKNKNKIEGLVGEELTLDNTGSIGVCVPTSGDDEYTCSANFERGRCLNDVDNVKCCRNGKTLGKESSNVQTQTPGGCNDNQTHCHKEGFTSLRSDFSDKWVKRKDTNNNFINCTISGSNECNATSGKKCYCYDVSSYGKCTENLACEGPTSRNDTDNPRPCTCGEGDEVTDANHYCFADTGKVFLGSDACNEAQLCYDNCGEGCNGQRCNSPGWGDGGTCMGDECVAGGDLCNKIPGADCLRIGNINPYPYSNEAEFRDIHAQRLYEKNYEDLTLAEQGRVDDQKGTMELKKYGELDGNYAPYEGNTNLRGSTYYRFPSDDEIKGIFATNNDAMGGTELDKLKDTQTADKFFSLYMPTNSEDIYNGAGSTFRFSLCGEEANMEGAQDGVAWNTVCAIKETNSAFGETGCWNWNAVDSLFGPPGSDPLSKFLWYKVGLSETLSFDLEDATGWDWKIGGAWGDMAEGYTELLCEMYSRKNVPEDQTATFPERSDTAELTLTVQGQQIPDLPDGTTLYEISWMILNKRGSGQDLNFSVYAYDEDTIMVDGEAKHPTVYAKDGSTQIKNQELLEGERNNGYYAFYYGKTPTNESVVFENACINTNTLGTAFCAPFINESYEGEVDISPPSGDNGGGEGDSGAGDDTYELDI